MKKILLLLISICTLPCNADTFGYLTEIIAVKSQPTTKASKPIRGIKTQIPPQSKPIRIYPKNLPFTITVQSSDTRGTVIDNNNQQVKQIQNVEFNLKDIKVCSFTIPWKGWEGDATVHVRVKKGNELIAQADFRDRDGKIFMINIKNAEQQIFPKSDGRSGKNCSVSIKLRVDATTGTIYLPQLDRNLNRFDCEK